MREYGAAITYREFEMGHEIRPEALKVLLQWLDERAFVPRGAPAG
jgi:predicted esterase